MITVFEAKSDNSTEEEVITVFEANSDYSKWGRE